MRQVHPMQAARFLGSCLALKLASAKTPLLSRQAAVGTGATVAAAAAAALCRRRGSII